MIFRVWCMNCKKEEKVYANSEWSIKSGYIHNCGSDKIVVIV